MGCGPESEQRGISHLVGAVLLIGITMTAVVLIIVAGTGTIGDVNEDNKAEVAGQTFAQTDEAFQAFARQDRNRSRTVELPESMNGDVEVRDSSWRLRLNDNSACTSGKRRLGAMHYDGEDQAVGYEGGGVWEVTESGARMDSPPKMTYSDGSLSVRFPNITGKVTTSNRISLSSNISRSSMQERNLAMALYTVHDYDYEGDIDDSDIECSPSELHQGTLWINDSAYAGAWANYFENNYDEPRVALRSSSPVESGDSVKVEFKLGDVSDPEYKVTDVDVSRNAAGEVEVEADVMNVGGLEGEQDVDVEFKDSSGTVLYSGGGSDQRIASGDTATYGLTTSSSLSSDDYTVEVSTEDDDVVKPIEIRGTGPPTPAITADAPQNASVGEDATLDVEVSNAGADMTAVRTVSVEVDGEVLDTRDVVVHPDSAETYTVSLPTDVPGSYDVMVETEEDSSVGDTDTYYVGSQPYYEISNVDSPDSVSATDEYEIRADITNRGQLQGQRDVKITLQNASRETNVTSKEETLTIDGQAYAGSSTESLSLSHTFTPGEEGTYRYIIETGNETAMELFTVGPPTNPNYVVEDMEFVDDPAWYGDEVSFEVTVKNNGGYTGNQEIQLYSEHGSRIWTEQVVLAPGEQTTIRKTRPITRGQFNDGLNRLTATTNNASDDESILIEKSNRIEDGDGSIEINKRVRAEITVLGAELEGRNTEHNYISQTPTTMWLDVTNGTTGREREIDLFQDRFGGDVNHPRAERAMIQNEDPYNPAYTRDNPYKHRLNLSEGSSLSLFAESKGCDEWQYTDVTWGDIEIWPDYHTDANTVACTQPDGTWIRASENVNSRNVVILGDGDEVPSFGAAHSYQRGLKDMLGSRITEDGTLSLADGERVFLYELSTGNADPDDAVGSGDPDYNDAVALFRVLEVQREVQQPPEIVIEDASDVPDQVPEGERKTFSVDVKNTGGSTGSTNVLFDLAEATPQQESVEDIEPGETRRVTFTVPGTLDGGQKYDFEIDVGSNPKEERHGKITIGTIEGPHFQVSQVDTYSVVNRSASPTVWVTVNNTGTDPDRQSIVFEDNDGTKSVTRSLDRGEETTVSFDLATPSPDGIYEYEVSTDDDRSITYKYFVGESDVHIERANSTTNSYREGELIQQRAMNYLSLKVVNDGSVGTTSDVRLVIDRDDGSNVFDETKTVSLGQGRVDSYPAHPSFNVSSDVSEGYYDYEATVSDGAGGTADSWSGKIFLQSDVDTGNSTNSSSPVEVDSNEVVIDG